MRNILFTFFVSLFASDASGMLFVDGRLKKPSWNLDALKSTSSKTAPTKNVPSPFRTSIFSTLSSNELKVYQDINMGKQPTAANVDIYRKIKVDLKLEGTIDVLLGIYELKNGSSDEGKQLIKNGMMHDDGWEYVMIFLEDLQDSEVSYSMENDQERALEDFVNFVKK
jgi:hypothetical protein